MKKWYSRYSNKTLDNAYPIDMSDEKKVKIIVDGKIVAIIGCMFEDEKVFSLYMDWDQKATVVDLRKMMGEEATANIEIMYEDNV